MDSQATVAELAAYFKGVRPYREYLTEHMARVPRERVVTAIEDSTSTDSLGLNLDPILLSEAWDLLAMSITNFLAYKQLMGGGYRSWGWVTLYYSNFYAASCLLRLAGIAALRLEWPGLEGLLGTHGPRRTKGLSIHIERVNGTHGYLIKRLKMSEHQFVFRQLATFFPELLTEAQGDLIRLDRVRENYDLRFPSQGLNSHALEDAATVFAHDFASPEYGAGWSPEASEYLLEVYASYGYKEDYSAQWIKTCVDTITEIGRTSSYAGDFEQHFKYLMGQTEKLTTKPSILSLIRTWLENAASEILNRHRA